MPRKANKARKEEASREERGKVEAVATISLYQPYVLDLGELAIYGYIPFEENLQTEKIESTSTVEALKEGTRILERLKNSMKNKVKDGLLLIDLSGRGFTIHLGAYINEPKWPGILLYRPARLNGVGKVIREGERWEVKWIRKTMPREFYVYEGEIKFAGEPFDIVLDTDQGMRVIFAEKKSMANGAEN
ncbi:MAG: hypothetical protein QW039_06230 [Fervidicoccaceae archaeon]